MSGVMCTIKMGRSQCLPPHIAREDARKGQRGTGDGGKWKEGKSGEEEEEEKEVDRRRRRRGRKQESV